jgi:hypothetical protein
MPSSSPWVRSRAHANSNWLEQGFGTKSLPPVGRFPSAPRIVIGGRRNPIGKCLKISSDADDKTQRLAEVALPFPSHQFLRVMMICWTRGCVRCIRLCCQSVLDFPQELERDVKKKSSASTGVAICFSRSSPLTEHTGTFCPFDNGTSIAHRE